MLVGGLVLFTLGCVVMAMRVEHWCGAFLWRWESGCRQCDEAMRRRFGEFNQHNEGMNNEGN